MDTCKRRRQIIRSKRWGQTGACAPQRVAYCFQVVESAPMSRQNMCARTMENCATTREDILNSYKVDHVTMCWPMLNTDAFDSPRDIPPPPIPDP